MRTLGQRDQFAQGHTPNKQGSKHKQSGTRIQDLNSIAAKSLSKKKRERKPYYPLYILQWMAH